MTTPDSGENEQRVLVLMRHAKSDWGDDSLSDHDRPLNERGNRDAPLMAQWLADIDTIPDLVACSSAVRTRETVALMTAQWAKTPEVSYLESLYLAHPETILKTAASDGGDARVLMVVAHNPAMTHLVSSLADKVIDMPTAAIAVFRLAISDWSELQGSSPVELIHFMRPKAL